MCNNSLGMIRNLWRADSMSGVSDSMAEQSQSARQAKGYPGSGQLACSSEEQLSGLGEVSSLGEDPENAERQNTGSRAWQESRNLMCNTDNRGREPNNHR